MSKRVITLSPFGWQHKALELIENHRIVVVMAGRGAGKSLLMQMATLREMFRKPVNDNNIRYL